MLNKILSPQQRLKKIFAVDKNQIKRIAQDLILEQKMNLILVGPFNKNKKGEFIKLLKF